MKGDGRRAAVSSLTQTAESHDWLPGFGENIPFSEEELEVGLKPKAAFGS